MATARKTAAASVEPEPQPEPRPKGAPRFRMSEGTREELERTGTAVDPYTGKTLTRDDL